MSSPGERPRCAACAQSKRKCYPECVYAPHFPADDPTRFAAVHAAFPVRNVGQLLRELPPDQRARTADLLVDMARARPDERLANNLQELRALLNPAPAPEPEASRPRCAACRRLHGSCTPDCVFAPFFPPDDDGSERFAAVHDVFGYKNAAAVLGGVSPDARRAAADALVYSTQARRRDPVRGCVGEISALTARLKQVHEQLAASKAVLAGYEDAAGAHAAGTSSSVETSQYDAMVREMAMHLAAFVEVAADGVRAEPGSSSGVTVAISAPRPSDEAGPSLAQEKPPPPPQEKAATATVGDPSPPPFARAAAPRPVAVDWHQLSAALEATRYQTMAGAHAWLTGSSSGATVASAAPRQLPAAEYLDQQAALRMARARQMAALVEVAREGDMTTTTEQAAADAHAAPGHSSGVTVAVLPPEAAPSVIQQQPPSQEQTETAADVGVPDPSIPKADDQGRQGLHEP